MHCLAEFGRLLEIGKYDMANRSKLPMHAMLKGVSYESIALDMLWVCPRRVQEVSRPCMRPAVTAVAADRCNPAGHRHSMQQCTCCRTLHGLCASIHLPGAIALNQLQRSSECW